MFNMMKVVNKANGFVFGGDDAKSNFSALMSSAVGAEFEFFRYPLMECTNRLFCVHKLW